MADLLKRGEDETIEFKTVVPRADIIARHLAAFANGEGGYLIFGVDNLGGVVGVDEAKVRARVTDARALVQGPIELQIKTFRFDGKDVSVGIVSPARGIVSVAGGFYQRRGDTIVPMSAENLRAHLLPTQPPDQAIITLSKAVSDQTVAIEQLRRAFVKANSWKLKVLIALGGALAGAILKAVADHVWP
ncbi:MAG: ATP-binding protein [Flavobacteriales bacterium]|nr:ATP-binding protein [Flavobacteriales bacterium]